MRITSFIIFFVIALASVEAHSGADELNVIAEEWPPYSFWSDGKVKGFSLEVLYNVLKISEKKYDVTIRILPSARIQSQLKKAKRTIMFSMYKTAARENQYKWIGPLIDGSIYFYKRKDNPVEIQSLEAAKKVKKIACRPMGIIYNILTNAGFSNLDTTSTDSIHIYRKLLSGRSDLSISDTPLGVAHHLKQMGYPLNALTQLQFKVFTGELYIATSKDISDEEIASLQKALDKFKRTERFKEILNSYQ